MRWKMWNDLKTSVFLIHKTWDIHVSNKVMMDEVYHKVNHPSKYKGTLCLPFRCGCILWTIHLSLGWHVNATIWQILHGFRYAMLLTINVYLKSYVVVSGKSILWNLLIIIKSKWNVDFRGCKVILHKIWLEVL